MNFVDKLFSISDVSSDQLSKITAGVDLRDDAEKSNSLHGIVIGLVNDPKVIGMISSSEVDKLKSFLAKINSESNFNTQSLSDLSSIYSFLKSGLVLNEMDRAKANLSQQLGGMIDTINSKQANAASGAMGSYSDRIASGNTGSMEKVDLVDTLYASWVSKMNDTKNKLTEIYKDKINLTDQSGYNKFNSPGTVLKVNKIIGEMNSYHTLITNTFARIFSTMSLVVNKMI